MTQTYRKALDRNTIRVSSDRDCRWGTDYTITKWTLAERIELFGGDPAELERDFIQACAANGKGVAYGVTDNLGQVNEFFGCFSDARSFVTSQFC